MWIASRGYINPKKSDSLTKTHNPYTQEFGAKPS